MLVMDSNLQALHHQALQRQARKLVDDLDELRAAQNAASRGLSQREIAGLLETSQAKVHRLLKAFERRGGNLEAGPEEIALRAFAYDTSRPALIRTLKAFPYTEGQDAPYPHEGRIPGTWDQVVTSFAKGLLSSEEFEEITRAVGR